MTQAKISLSEDIELIIDEPDSVSSYERPLIVTSAIVQEFSSSLSINPSIRTGYLPITIGSRIYSIYYELRTRRVINALTAYSHAILHIRQNPHLYDRRLASKAIEVLIECYKENLN